ncbi:MAG: hypothetical protein RTU30_13980 [Candidatus Thorarchaeota archaeon]
MRVGIGQIVMKLVIASVMHPDKHSEVNALLLAGSIRSFAGSLSDTPIWYYIPGSAENVTEDARNRLSELNVRLIPFDIDTEMVKFPFMGHAFAAAQAEVDAQEQTELLAWVATNTLILHEPNEFTLGDDKELGYRPVHHTLVGSRYHEPLDAFWTEVYKHCNVPEDRVFPMTAHVDGIKIRPYFNAGSLITRPQNHVFTIWRDTFLRLYQEDVFQEFYKVDDLYAIFIHQAILSGVILAALETQRLHELPSDYNYPLHLFNEDITENRPPSLDELVIIRHEGFHKDPDWMNKIHVRDELKQWIARQIEW